MPRSSKHMLEFAARVRQLAQSGPEAVTGSDQLRGPWFNSADGACYLRQPTRGAFRAWARRHGVVPVRKAGLVLYAKADVDRVLGVIRRSA